MPAPLAFYDNFTRTLRPFEPLHAGEVSIYLCGATLQSIPHIGHVRGAVNFDVLRRWMSASCSTRTKAATRRSRARWQ